MKRVSRQERLRGPFAFWRIYPEKRRARLRYWI